MTFFFLCALLGFPLSCSKTAGGDTVAWVGFESMHRSYYGDLSSSCRMVHEVDREVASNPVANMDTFEEGPGRVMCVAGALEYERPFFAPLHKFLNLHPRGSNVAFILWHVSNQVERERHYSCATHMLSEDTSPRVDAQASEARTGIGRWLPVGNKQGVPDPWLSPWFSAEVTQEVLPWVYVKGGKPSLIISTLEALAVLVSLKMFYGEQPAIGKKKITVAPAWTDNRGTGSAVNKLTTSMFPACAVLMELSACMKRMSMKVAVEWTPRAGNREADQVANGDYRAFNPQNRVNLDLARLQWDILPEVLGLGRAAEEDVRSHQQSRTLPQRNVKRRRRKPEERMRLKDPW